MRAILIDPFKRTVTEIDTAASLDDMYDILVVDTITVVRVGEDHALILDDEGLLKPKEEQEYWWAEGAAQPYAGRGLIIGDKYGENRDATMSVDFVREHVRFVEPEDKEFLDPDYYTGMTFVAI